MPTKPFLRHLWAYPSVDTGNGTQVHFQMEKHQVLLTAGPSLQSLLSSPNKWNFLEHQSF